MGLDNFEFHTSITGTYFLGHEAQGDLKNLKIGSELALKREISNVYDSNAIMVIFYPEGDTDRHRRPLGYIPKTDNTRLAGLMDKGVKLIAIYKGDKKIKVEECEDDDDEVEFNDYADYDEKERKYDNLFDSWGGDPEEEPDDKGWG